MIGPETQLTLLEKNKVTNQRMNNKNLMSLFLMILRFLIDLDLDKESKKETIDRLIMKES